MSRPDRILIVDDEASDRTALAERLRADGYAVETTADGRKVLAKIEELAPDVVLANLKMPELDGIDLMQRVHAHDPECVFIVMTALGGIDTAVLAMRQGAADYLTKPVNVEELSLVLARELERKRLRAETAWPRAQLSAKNRISNMIGSTPVMQQLFDVITQVAVSRASVIISGESGTGKELVAAAMHEHSPRRHAPFIKLHCAALSESLLESELFGHERGAFTGAVGRREGRFQQADHGTLFLDEISEIPPSIQVKLLRFLQEREFERVGGNQTIKVDVRIIAATNRNLSRRVKEGLFREDLYYRLNVVSIEMPALRARPSDVPLLAMHFLARFAAENNKGISGFSDEALALLIRYSWPGNVRELGNVVERAVVVCRDQSVGMADLSPAMVAIVRAGPEGLPPIPGASIAELERYAIVKTMEHTGGATALAAEILGISKRTIQYRLQEYQTGDPASHSTRPASD